MQTFLERLPLYQKYVYEEVDEKRSGLVEYRWLNRESTVNVILV